MAGIEVEAIEPAAPAFDRVVVGEVLEVERHPDADAPDGVPGQRRGRAAHDRLRRAQRASRASRCRRRCSARNCRARRSRSPRCAASNRTACCARPRSWACRRRGRTAGAAGRRAGRRDVREVLDLDDQLLTLKPTPNRGDCLSITRHGARSGRGDAAHRCAGRRSRPVRVDDHRHASVVAGGAAGVPALLRADRARRQRAAPRRRTG